MIDIQQFLETSVYVGETSGTFIPGEGVGRWVFSKGDGYLWCT